MSQFVTFNSVIGNSKAYKIPIYQRDYSWSKEDWEDLWQDILDIPTDKNHYLGYLVLQPMGDGGDETYWVIDGQQRLTTLSLLALAITALLKTWSEQGLEPQENKLRAEKIFERYLGNFSTSRLTITPKLTLNRNDNDYYANWLLKYRRPPSLAKLKPSQRLLQKAFDYFLEQLNGYFTQKPSGAAAAEFLERTVGNGILFTQIVVNNDLDAFKVFETLNARGVKLSTADLLKNYLFGLIARLGNLELNEAERRWQSIADTLGANDLTTFIRHYWNSKHRLERQTALFKAIQRHVDDPERAFHFLEDLEKNCQFYTAFHYPYDELWTREERQHLTVLNLLGVTTCYPLMLAFLNYGDRKDFAILLREIATLSLRYHLADINPNTAERVYSNVANQVSAGTLSPVRDVVLALKDIYVDDKTFESAFANARISTKQKKALVKYLLIKLENQIANTDYSPEDTTATIEHILPENPGEVWEEAFPPDIQHDYIYRLGNYTLLKAGVNHRLGSNTPFSEKRAAYQQSSFKLSSEYCNYEEFTPATLCQRQERLAKVAQSVWRSAFLK